MSKYDKLLKAIDEYVEEVKADKPNKDEFVRLLQKIALDCFIDDVKEFKEMVEAFEKTRWF